MEPVGEILTFLAPVQYSNRVRIPFKLFNQSGLQTGQEIMVKIHDITYRIKLMADNRFRIIKKIRRHFHIKENDVLEISVQALQ